MLAPGFRDATIEQQITFGNDNKDEAEIGAVDAGRHISLWNNRGMAGDARFMRMAIELATENVTSGRGGPFGAVIVRGGEVVATGANSVTGACDPTAHAEVTAIRNACAKLGTFELRGCEIYSSCEPCPMCLTAIMWARCDGLFYASTAEDAARAGFDDSYFYEQVRKPVGERDLATGNLLRDEAEESFKAWREFAGRVEY